MDGRSLLNNFENVLDKGYSLMPINVSTVAEYLSLLIERNIFSRDDMLIYQGREEGRAAGKVEAIIDFLSDIVELPDSLKI